DIDDLSFGFRSDARRDGCGHRVGHIGEAARLLSIADYRQVGAAQQLPHEDRKQSPDVDLVEPRAIDVEVAHHGYRQAELVVRKAEVFADRLGGGVTPAVDGGRAEYPVVVLAPGHLGIAAIDLRGRAEHYPLSILVSSAEYVLGSVDVDVES